MGNHHNNPHNSLLWPITQTRRVPGLKNSRLGSNDPAKVGKVSGCVVGCGCAGWGCGCVEVAVVGSKASQDTEHPTADQPHCAYVCVPTYCAHNSLSSIGIHLEPPGSKFVVPNRLQRLLARKPRRKSRVGSCVRRLRSGNLAAVRWLDPGR